jgi:hypothetical protein
MKLQFDDFLFAAKKRTVLNLRSLHLDLTERKNGARSSLINCMMIPTALDFPLAIKESL